MELAENENEIIPHNEQIAKDLLNEVIKAITQDVRKDIDRSDDSNDSLSSRYSDIETTISDDEKEDEVMQINGHLIINGTLYSKHIADEDLYLTGDNTYYILPGDGYRLVYADTNSGVINIILGTIDNYDFERNRRITFKDVSLGSMNNVNIIVPNCGTRIEYYHNNILTIGPNAGYSINSNGGAVTLRYFISPVNKPAWVIESQFLGQPRMLPSIISRPDNNRQK